MTKVYAGSEQELNDDQAGLTYCGGACGADVDWWLEQIWNHPALAHSAVSKGTGREDCQHMHSQA